jgi:magnesium transporter
MEEVILTSPAEKDISRIHEVRSQLLTIRHPLLPLREVVKMLASEEMPPIAEETRLYFRDCLDHLKHLTDTIETNRELARSLIDLCLSSLSNQMNEVMKLLTIIATIFIPLGFIAGLYGMNFNPEISPYNLPYLNWRLGYPYALSLMALTTTGLLIFFWRKGWLGKQKR